MTNPNTLVEAVKDLSETPGPPERAYVQGKRPSYLTVTFERGGSCVLDMEDPRSPVWASVLESLRQTGQPAYVEIDPQTNVITDLRCPLTVRVGEINPTPSGDLEVALIISHARHFLRRATPDFENLLQLLRKAQEEQSTILVTEKPDKHDIVDVRTTA